jgi:ABC-type branched-subunit amino acid transport system substrate-binding protein
VKGRWAVVLTLLVTVVTACGNSGGGNQPTDTTPIKLGAWNSLTGPIAVHGLAQKAGADAYFKFLNDHGGIKGRKIAWIVEDNAYDPTKTVTAAHKLIDQENVLAIVGSNGTAQTAAAFPYVLDQAQVPIINTYGGAAAWYSPARPLLFGLQTTYEDQATILGKWAAKDGYKDILVIHSDPAAFVNVANQVSPGIKSVNPSATVRDLSVKFNTTDYAPIVLQVKNMHPDAVVAILATGELVAYLKQAGQQGLKTGVYSYAPNASADMIRLAGQDAEGLKSEAWTLPPDDASPAVKEFVAAMAKYESGATPDYESLFMWAAAKIAAQAISRINGPINKDSITKAMEGLTNYDSGVMPPVTYTSGNHLGSNQIQRVQLTGGKWVTVGKYVSASSNF